MWCDVALSENEIRAATVGEPKRLSGPIPVVGHDPAWPEQFLGQAERIRSALGARVQQLEHVGSTWVPGLAAKPVLDLVLAVADSADEDGIPACARADRLSAAHPGAGMVRAPHAQGPPGRAEPARLLLGCPEVTRMLLFRDWLRAHEDDREAYAAAKRELAGQDWAYLQNYADAKTPVVEAILARANKGELPSPPRGS